MMFMILKMYFFSYFRDDLRAGNPSMARNSSMIRIPLTSRNTSKGRNRSIAKVPSITSLAFNIPTTNDDRVISLENLPMSIDDIEEHYSVIF